eukprot:11248662-Prorocentrum_lima.AAC.1
MLDRVRPSVPSQMSTASVRASSSTTDDQIEGDSSKHPMLPDESVFVKQCQESSIVAVVATL